jgi:hypothetical protein
MQTDALLLECRFKSILALALLITVAVSGCGGGGGGSSAPKPAATASGSAASAPTVVAVSDNYSALQAQCATPRPAGTVNPFTGALYGDTQGSLLTENEWIRDYVYDTYLWYADVPSVDPTTYVIGATVPYVNPANNQASTETVTTNYQVVDAYFNSQRSPLYSDANPTVPKDRFHFTYPTSTWVAMEQTGAVAGYGFTPEVLEAYPPRNVAVAYTDVNTPAAAASIARGAQIVSVDGVDVVNGSDVTTINSALFTPAVGSTHAIGVLDFGSSVPRTVNLTAAVLPEVPVEKVGTVPGTSNTVGYIQFNEHIAPAETALFSAFTTLSTANNGAPVTDLVVDMRYNGGGLLDIASELASMIASSATANQTFERESFNDKNPFGLSAAQATTPFWQTTQGYSTSIAVGTPLPHLNLTRVFVILTGATCSASEAVINGLRGVGVTVYGVGAPTCGKPYGFFPADNCSTTYFTIQFAGVNAAGFGGYADGFVPSFGTDPSVDLPGCLVADDYSKPLGDPTERNLAVALALIAAPNLNAAAEVCPQTGTVNARLSRPAPHDTSKAGLFRPALLENRFVDLTRLKARLASPPHP